MKKIGYLILFSWLCCGCILPREVDKNTVLKEEKPVYESILPETKEEKETQSETSEFYQETQMSNETKAKLMRQQQNLYAFSNLEITQQNLYVEMLYALTNYVEEMQLSTLNTKEIDKVFQCVMIDHPEIFYADGYSFVKYMLGNKVNKITFSGTYLYDREEKATRELLIEETAEEIIQGIDAQASDYEKVKYIYETIIHRTEYVTGAEDNQNICSVLISNRSVCQGYAKAAQYLLQKMGVPVSLVTGTVHNGDGHAWNLVTIDNEYYYVDVTWGDASYQKEKDNIEGKIDYISKITYDYLCITTQELLKTHRFSDVVSWPVCTATKANYYRKEGAYFETFDSQQLQELINRYKAEGRECITLKCANEVLYEKMVEKLLLKEQEIFHYLSPEDKKISYTNSSGNYSITFWILR